MVGKKGFFAPREKTSVHIYTCICKEIHAVMHCWLLCHSTCKIGGTAFWVGGFFFALSVHVHKPNAARHGMVMRVCVHLLCIRAKEPQTIDYICPCMYNTSTIIQLIFLQIFPWREITSVHSLKLCTLLYDIYCMCRITDSDEFCDLVHK